MNRSLCRATALAACALRFLRQGAVAVALLASGAVVAAALAEGALPPAQTDGGMPLMRALKERRTVREFDNRPLATQTVSNLLWAAFGVNRPANGGRTAPSAHDQQEIEIYVATAEGLFVYDAVRHRLARVRGDDLRPLTGTQAHAREAPLTLVYVANERRMRDDETWRRFYAAADSGFIAQNVYLFCASEGLGTVVFAAIERERLAQAMQLAPSQRIVLAQSVGYPRR
jgi:nitroreductase